MLKFSHFLFAFSIVLLGNMSSCKSQEKTTTNNAKSKKMVIKKDIPFTILLQNGHSNITEQKNIVIKDKKSLNAIYSKINSTRKPGLPIPKIDFSKTMVLGMFMGTKNSGGYSIHINRIESNDKEMVVFYTEKAPKGRATMAITQPCLLVSTVVSNLPVRFELVK